MQKEHKDARKKHLKMGIVIIIVVCAVSCLSQNNLRTDFFTAVMYGDITKIRNMVVNGFDVNKRDSSGQTALMYACHEGNYALVNYLLMAGANVDLQDRRGYTALITAVEHDRDLGIVRLLVRFGADLEIYNRYDLTALTTAIRYGFYHHAKLLLDLRADLYSPNGHGKTGIDIALEHPNIEIIELLLATGADLPLERILTFLIQVGASEVVYDYIRDSENKQVNIPDRDGRTPLMWASIEKSDPYTNVMIIAGYDLIDIARKRSETPIFENGEKSKLVLALLNAGARISSRDRYGLTPLMYAAAFGSSEILQFLLQEGAQVNSRDIDGWSALMYAVVRGHCAAVELLAAAGADVNLQNNEGDSAATLATN